MQRTNDRDLRFDFTGQMFSLVFCDLGEQVSEEGIQGHTAESTSQSRYGPVFREWSVRSVRILYYINYFSRMCD